MGKHRVATVSMPFEMWRLILHQGPLSPEQHQLGHQASQLIEMQVVAQTQHANCDSPKVVLVHSPHFTNRYMMKIICTCGEMLTAADNLAPEVLERIGPRGAFRPALKPEA